MSIDGSNLVSVKAFPCNKIIENQWCIIRCKFRVKFKCKSTPYALKGARTVRRGEERRGEER